MEKQIYITDEEQKKCRKVADAFADLEDEDIIVVDMGRYGFIKLEYYTPPYGFEDFKTFTESQTLFEDLWYEWLYAQIDSFAKDTPLSKLDDVDDIFKCMPEKTQRELLEKRKYFAEKAGIDIKN